MMYELLIALESAGWQCRVVDSDVGVPEARRSPHLPGDGAEKVWYMCHKKSVIKRYLVCLLTAQAHGFQVPHFAAHRTYAQIMDP